MQFAVAAAAYLNMTAGGQLHQVWSQPPGTGKTRTLISLVYILANLGGHKDITVRCPGKHILVQDEEALAELAEAVKAAGTRIRLATGVQNLGSFNAIELIDECDTVILDNERFDQLRLTVGNMVGFTATPLKDAHHSSEKDLVAALGIHVHDSHVPAMGAMPAGEKENLPELTLEEFLDPGRSQAARLVYCTKADRWMAAAANLLPSSARVTRFDPATYKQLEAGTVMVIEPRHGRGLDFRAMEGGSIDLLVAAQLPHQRALVQLLGRVGRYGQACGRFKLTGLGALVNPESARGCRHRFSSRAEKLNQPAGPEEESKEPARTKK